MRKSQCEYRGCTRPADVIRSTVGGNYPMTFCSGHDPLTDDRVKAGFATPEVGP